MPSPAIAALRRVIAAVPSACLLAALLASCGGQPNAELGSSTAAEKKADPLAAGLPAISELPAAPLRDISSAGTGLLTLQPQETLRRQLVSDIGGGGIELTAGSGLSYALYGLAGFDGDSRPDSLRLSIGQSSPPQQYYVAYSDYVQSRWKIAGPFNSVASVQDTDINLDYDDAHPWSNSFTTQRTGRSTLGTIYFAILTRSTEPGSIDLSGLQVGVFGGSFGPRPGKDVYRALAGGGVLVRWSPSPDFAKPDFAGYVVERADLFGGTFEKISPGPSTDDYFQDTSVSTPYYRYRVYAVDTSGNRSSYFPDLPSGVLAIGDNSLVARVDCPRGPLFGAQVVTFDMSASFDAGDGGALDDYKLVIPGLHLDLSGPDPLKTVLLQPGCYSIRANVSQAGNEGPLTYRQLVVYPTWEEVPHQLSDAPGTLSRLKWARGGRNPEDGQLYFVGYDATLGALVAYRRVGNADYELLDSVPMMGSIIRIDSPVKAFGGLCFMFETDIGKCSFVLVNKNGMTFVGQDFALPHFSSLADADGPLPTVPIIAALDAGGGLWSIDAVLLLSPSTHVNILTGGSAITALDAVHNPATGRIDVIYSNVSGTYFASVDLNTVTLVVAPQLLSATTYNGLDIEYDPVTLRSVAVGNVLGRNHSLEWDDSYVLTDTFIDNSQQNYLPEDLIVTDAGVRYCAFAAGSGACNLYHCDNGSNSWVRDNTMDYSPDSAYSVSIIQPTVGTGVTIADADNLGNVFIARTDAGDVETVITQVYPSSGSGTELTACADSSGVHAVWLQYDNGDLLDAMSPDGGENWTVPSTIEGIPSQTNAFLTSAYTVDVTGAPTEGYISYRNGVNFTLRAYNGVGWVTQDTSPYNDYCVPLLPAMPLTSGIQWIVYDSVASKYHNWYGNTTSHSTSDLDQVLGHLMHFGAQNNYVYQFTTKQTAMYLATGTTPTGLNIVDIGDGTARAIAPINTSVLEDSAEITLLDDRSKARALATSTYQLGADQHANVFWMGMDDTHMPLRYEEQPVEVYGTQFIRSTHLPGFSTGADEERRRTISAVQAPGETAVGVITSLDGDERYMEWSNFGDWEQLKIPTGERRIAFPDLLVDGQGRWYFFYQDVSDQQVYCIRTQVPVV